MAQFQYLLVTPDKVKRNDCVTRAITHASGLPYNKVRKKLFHTARLLDCEKLCWTCYSFLIDKVLNYKQVNCDYMTVGEFADLHPQGTYLIRIHGHLTMIKNNVVYDIWDCRHKTCDIAWKKA